MSSSRRRSISPLTSRVGGWLPTDPAVLGRWLHETIEVAEKNSAPFHPVVAEFQALIEDDAILYMYFIRMFEEQPQLVPPPGSGDVKIKNYQQMLVVINHVLTTAPEYNDTGMVGFPINAILDFPMITPAGLAAFRLQSVNDILRKVLAAWTEFLDDAKSLYVLNDSSTGWLSPAAKAAIHLDEFQTNPDQPYLGFTSWNDFFIRQFKAGARPVAQPDDDRVIVSACESTPYAIATSVKEEDTFWVKSQPYSLRHLLAGSHVEEFIGGTIYQAFLSAENYHRWHSPVSGTVTEVRHIPGTYYAEAASEGFDPAGPNNSQGFIAQVATRALIFIEADNPTIGLLCLVPIGMAEVSSCLVTVAEGQHVTKGDQVGYFQFGGSTHCLVLRPGVVSEFVLGAIPQGADASNSTLVKLNSMLASTG
jgi:phosphatidylserine decarboxylase